MKGIQSLLSKYKKIKAPEKSRKDIFIKTVLTNTGIELNHNEFKINKNTIHLKCHSVIREEILQNKQNILNKYNQQTNDHVLDIF